MGENGSLILSADRENRRWARYFWFLAIVLPVAAVGVSFHEHLRHRTRALLAILRERGGTDRELTWVRLSREDEELKPLLRLLIKAKAPLYLTLTKRPTDESLKVVGEMTWLSSLDLQGLRITDRGLSYLTRLKNLRSLNLWDTTITDKGLVYVAELRSLRDLNLINTRITDQGLRHLETLTSLRTLSLGDLRLTQQGMTCLADLSSLENLSVGGQHVTDQVLLQLSSIKSLRLLTIGDRTQVTPSAVEEFKKRRPRLGLQYSPCLDASVDSTGRSVEGTRLKAPQETSATNETSAGNAKP